MGSAETNVLGLSDVDDYLLVFEGMLNGRFLNQIKVLFAEGFSPDYLRQHSSKIEQSYAAIRESLLFRAMF